MIAPFHRITPYSVWLLAVYLGLAPGCTKEKSEDPCEELFVREKKCSGNFMAVKPTFLKLCHEQKTQGLQSDFQCLVHQSCDAFLNCQHAGSKKKLDDILEGQLKTLAAKKDFLASIELCHRYASSPPEPRATMCDQAINAQYKIYRSELEKARDKGAPYQKQCDQLIGFAEKHAKKQLKDAREGCMEAQFSRFNTLARERIQKYTRLKKMYLPAYCRIKYLKQFENMKNAYIKKGFDELVHSCYHEFGAAILKKQVPLMKKTCTISHLLPGFSRYKITSNILLPLLEKARTICSQGK